MNNNFAEFVLEYQNPFIPSRVRHFSTIDSTNDALKKHLSLNQKPMIFLADYQTKGRGRYLRAWHSPPKSGLLVSFPIKCPKKFSHSEHWSIFVGLALHYALSKLGLKNLAIKWPNDLLVNNKKIAGILCERTIKANASSSLSENIIITGVGVNLLETSFHPTIKNSVTSLQNELAKAVEQIDLLKLIHQNLADLLNQLADGRENKLWQEWQRYSLNDDWKKETSLNSVYNS